MQGTTASNISDSDITKSLNIEMDPKKIEVSSLPQANIFAIHNWKKFCLGTLITAMVPTLIILTYVVIYFIDYKLFKKMFKGYSRPLNGFDVFAYCIFPVLMAIPSIFPKFCRKITVLLILPIIACFVYIPAFLIRLGIKERFNFSEYLVSWYTVYVCAMIGLFANFIMTKEKFSPDNGVIITTVMTALLLILYVYVLRLYNPYKFTLALITAAAAALGFYLNYDLKFMIKKRADFYESSDWFLGFIHLHTDLFFRFWRDIFRKDAVMLATSADQSTVKEEERKESNTSNSTKDDITGSDLGTVDVEGNENKESKIQEE